MKISIIGNITYFQMFIVVFILFILLTIIFGILKYNYHSNKYNKDIAQFKSIVADVTKCELLIDEWSETANNSSTTIRYPNFRPIYYVTYSILGKNYNNVITTPFSNGFRNFRTAHKALCKIIGRDSIKVWSIDGTKWLFEDVLYIADKDYVNSFTDNPTYKLNVEINPDNPTQVNLKHTKNIHVIAPLILVLFTISLSFIFWGACNYSDMFKIVTILILFLVSILTGMRAESILDLLPKKTTKYSFTISSEIDINHIKNYIREENKEVLYSNYKGLLKEQ